MVVEIHFGVGHSRNFEGLMTLNFNMDDLEGAIEHMAPSDLIVDLRTSGRGRMDGHLLTNITGSSFAKQNQPSIIHRKY